MASAGLDSTLRDLSPRELPPREPSAREPSPQGEQGSAVRALPGAAAPARCPTCGERFPTEYVVCPRDATPLGVGRGAERDPLIGVVLAGTYRLTRVLGRGGMGRLYEADHARLGRRFAVKVLHESHADRIEAVRRFEREADALSRIRSDFVLDVVDVLRAPDGRTAIVTALLEGEDLQRRLDRAARLPAREAMAIARQVCRGLAAAHAAEVVHRDLKPSNLFLEAAPDGRLAVKILDFGVAKLAGEEEMTRTGVVLGTPAYMAPEQARGSSRADARSDVYAVGAVLYRMATGRMPYEGSDPGATLARLIADAPPRPRAIAPDVPIALEVVIQRAMARDPAERPASALELEAALAALDGEAGGGDDAPLEGGGAIGAAARMRSEEPDTIVLSRGAVERAERMERAALSARPFAGLLVIGATLAIGASAAGAIAAGAALAAAGDAQEALGRALAIVGGLTCALGALASLSRWMAPRWSSAPAVQHATARLARATAAGLSTLGAAALLAIGARAYGLALPGADPERLLAALAAAALAAALGATKRRPSP